jgi:hypothetical protein
LISAATAFSDSPLKATDEAMRRLLFPPKYLPTISAATGTSLRQDTDVRTGSALCPLVALAGPISQDTSGQMAEEENPTM